MSLDQILVTAAGAAGIGWVYWYFFAAAPRQAVAAVDSSIAQEATIVVDGGYSPSVLQVKVGRPVRISFDRKDRGSCTEEVIFADFGVRRFLPTGEITTVEFTPTAPGTFDFACGMGMVHGQLQVRK
jgi:plastocyanin domain-containing protein